MCDTHVRRLELIPFAFDDAMVRGALDANGGPQEIRTISESGLYALIFRSRKPEARRFRKWVTAEVLPQLRRQGW